MADSLRITVCVIALTQDDYQGLDPTVRAKLAALFATPGKPYHKSSPDEWRPFDIDSVSQYLTNANIEASFLSVQLDDEKRRTRALRETSLYIVDPVVLLHGPKGDRLAKEIQIAIYAGEKSFCIILPDIFADTLRTELRNNCQVRLKDLWDSWKDQDDYDLVESHERFQKYLFRLARLLTSKPDQNTLASAQAIYKERGVAAPNLNQVPHLGRGAG
jgi:hypothetical protein